MRFSEYKSNFERMKQNLSLEGVQREVGPLLCPTNNRDAPPWFVDWALLFADGMHVHVKETYVPQPHPNFLEGRRKHFSFQYGATTGTDRRGMPRTTHDRDTVIRLDEDPFSVHMHLGALAHIQQHEISGQFVIAKADLFNFIDAVRVHRETKGCKFEEILMFRLRNEGRR